MHINTFTWHIGDEKIEISRNAFPRAPSGTGDPVRAFTAKCLLFVNELTRRNASEKRLRLGQGRGGGGEMKSVSPVLSGAPGWNSSCKRGNAESAGGLLIRDNGALENSSATTSARATGHSTVRALKSIFISFDNNFRFAARFFPAIRIRSVGQSGIFCN